MSQNTSPISETWSKHPIEFYKTPEKADTSCKIDVNNTTCKLRVRTVMKEEQSLVAGAKDGQCTL